ncbi:hypothetical protein [Gillisia sp. Hel_I_29]|jgi:uncharacterized protein YodC (DUF2158 family)|uniref:hypothetical protein n=1 Tax=Gillisia sp. Hel_I_29 TaxID=1249975 RepID=UPI00055953B8|nr:hypothetical protein [Gillisia sp. Hel_I_29]
MGKYTIKDFKIGDKVYHLSNTSLIMVVIGIHNDINEVECRWMDKNGKVQIIGFLGEELGKTDDLRPRISVI